MFGGNHAGEPYVNGIFSSSCSGVLVPGGFGVRGTEGKIQAISWARKQKKPFLGEKHVTSIRRNKEKKEVESQPNSSAARALLIFISIWNVQF